MKRRAREGNARASSLRRRFPQLIAREIADGPQALASFARSDMDVAW